MDIAKGILELDINHLLALIIFVVIVLLGFSNYLWFLIFKKNRVNTDFNYEKIKELLKDNNNHPCKSTENQIYQTDVFRVVKEIQKKIDLMQIKDSEINILLDKLIEIIKDKL